MYRYYNYGFYKYGLFQCDEGGGAADGIKTEPPEAEEPRTMQKVPSLSDLSDPEASLGKYLSHLHHIH